MCALRIVLCACLLALLGSPATADDSPLKKIRLLIITGSHSHDWKGTLPVLEDLYKKSGRFEVTVTLDPRKDLTAESLARFDAFLLHYKETKDAPGRWPEAAEKALLEAVRGGKGLAVLHYASSAFDDRVILALTACSSSTLPRMATKAEIAPTVDAWRSCTCR